MRCICITSVTIFLLSHLFLPNVLAQEIISDHVSRIQTKKRFDSTPVDGGPAGTLTITVKYKNIQTKNLTELAFRVVKLTGGNLLLNADGNAGGVGSILTVPFSGDYSDGILGPEEKFTVNFVIGRASLESFKFKVEALGMIQQDLKFIFPYAGQEVAGDNVLVWAAEVESSKKKSKKEVVFETSLDGQSFKLLLPQEAPDLGKGSHTTALDTTVFPPGPLFLRARFKENKSGPIIQLIVNNTEEAFVQTNCFSCGCEKMIIKTTGNSVIGDPRREDDNGTPDDPADDTAKPAPLGIDPDFLSFNFEIVATLTPGSNPELCEEGQDVKATFESDGKIVSVKQACTAGVTLAICKKNRDCDTSTCIGGTQTGASCDTQFAAENCLNGNGICEPNHDGLCTEFPFEGFLRGNDDYKSPTDLGLKTHLPSPTWFDAPGIPTSNRADVQFDLLANFDFLAFVRGPQGSCSCHFTLTIDWDGTNQVHRPGTALTLISDEDTFRCEQQ